MGLLGNPELNIPIETSVYCDCSVLLTFVRYSDLTRAILTEFGHHHFDPRAVFYSPIAGCLEQAGQ
jgi:hypothetical protein